MSEVLLLVAFAAGFALGAVWMFHTALAAADEAAHDYAKGLLGDDRRPVYPPGDDD